MKKNPNYVFFAMALFFLLIGMGVPVSGAENAVIAPLATKSLLLDIVRAGNDLVAVGERGHVLLSADNGTSWEQVQVPTRATLTSIFFLDELHGWIVGHDQVILRSTDGGRSWEQVYANIEAEAPLLDIIFLDSKHGYAIGAYGQFLESFDGGSSWQGRWISEDDFHLNQIITAGEQLFIAAEAGYAYRSADNGKNWDLLNPDYMGSFFGIFATQKNNLLLFGLRGHLFRSEDSGASWVEIKTGTEASLTCGVYLQDGSLALAGLAGTFMRSNDDGEHFKLQEDTGRKGFSKLVQAADGAIIAVGDFGVAKIELAGAGESDGN